MIDARFYPLNPNGSLQPSLDLSDFRQLDIGEDHRGVVVRKDGCVLGILVTAET